MKGDAVEKAILYIKDYTQRTYARTRSEQVERLVESVNTLIEHYNRLNALRSEYENTVKLRDMFLLSILGEYREDYFGVVEIAKKVPVHYYVKRISEHYMDEPVAKRILNTVRDYKLLDTCKETISKERELLDYMKERGVSDELIRKAEENIEYYREEMNKLL